MDKKKFMRLAVAGLIIGRAAPAVSVPSDVASDIDAALQKARSEQLSVEAMEDGAFDAEEETVGLY